MNAARMTNAGHAVSAARSGSGAVWREGRVGLAMGVQLRELVGRERRGRARGKLGVDKADQVRAALAGGFDEVVGAGLGAVVPELEQRALLGRQVEEVTGPHALERGLHELGGV